MLKAVIDHFGHIDIVVNSAGQSLSSKITDYNVEQWDTMIDVNIKVHSMFYKQHCLIC